MRIGEMEYSIPDYELFHYVKRHSDDPGKTGLLDAPPIQREVNKVVPEFVVQPFDVLALRWCQDKGIAEHISFDATLE